VWVSNMAFGLVQGAENGAEQRGVGLVQGTESVGEQRGVRFDTGY
jgi:hypothetical protein